MTGWHETIAFDAKCEADYRDARRKQIRKVLFKNKFKTILNYLLLRKE